jgi:alpha-beta hydrolase superfamily lysophospholipase
MTKPQHERLTLDAEDGHEIHAQLWLPADQAKGVIQIIHGLGEHGNRYARFAAAAVSRDFVVAVHDHRGHGEQRGSAGFFAAKNGWQLLVADSLIVQEFLAKRFAGLPVTLLGHSMGSYVAQDFAMHHGGRLGALLLSASTWAPRVETLAGNLLARIECWRLGAHRHSALLDKLGFGDFNKPFAPARTDHDWLSRDPDEVDAYIADPLCGGPYTAGLWRDLTGGLLRIATDDYVSRIPSDLPILITGGEQDPVGGERGMGKLALHYAQTGHGRLTVKIYPEGRHEMLNDINRDEVTRDWLNWIESNL